MSVPQRNEQGPQDIPGVAGAATLSQEDRKAIRERWAMTALERGVSEAFDMAVETLLAMGDRLARASSGQPVVSSPEAGPAPEPSEALEALKMLRAHQCFAKVERGLQGDEEGKE